MCTKSYEVNQQGMVFQPNSLGMKRKKTTDEDNDGNLNIYINRDGLFVA